jgi:hypothetical protein
MPDLQIDAERILLHTFKDRLSENSRSVQISARATLLIEGFRYLQFPYPKGRRVSKAPERPSRYELIQHKVVKRIKLVLRLVDDPFNGTKRHLRKAVYRIDFDKVDRDRCPYVGWTGAWQNLYGKGYYLPEDLDIDDVADAWYAAKFMVRRKLENERVYDVGRLLAD